MNTLEENYSEIEVITYYLKFEKFEEHEFFQVPSNVKIEKIENMGVAQYREMFLAVGSEWGWSGRLILPDEELQQELLRNSLEIYKLFYNNQFAGFAEIDCANSKEIEILYFGLIPEFIGKGLGRLLMNFIKNRAKNFSPSMLFLHTCNHDHPKALTFYQKSGFVLFNTEISNELYPLHYIQKHLLNNSCT